MGPLGAGPDEKSGAVRDLRPYAAAMTIYLKYQHYQGDIDGVAALEDLKDADFVSFGGLISF